MKCICILKGMPQAQALGVLAHEFLHAYMFLKAYPSLAPNVEEGVCEVGQHLWLQQQAQDSFVSFRLMQMRLNKDRVYGDGYRSALSALAKAGSLVNVLKAVKSSRTLPY